MRVAATLVMALALIVSFWTGVDAGEKKEVTIKGNITCAKCELMVEGQKGCATVIVEKKGAKDVVYYFDKAAHKKWHADICKAGKAGQVTGTVSEAKGKKIVTVKSLEYKK